MIAIIINGNIERETDTAKATGKAVAEFLGRCTSAIVRIQIDKSVIAKVRPEVPPISEDGGPDIVQDTSGGRLPTNVRVQRRTRRKK